MKRLSFIFMAVLCSVLSPMPLLAQSGGSGNVDSNQGAEIAELSFPDEGDYSELGWGASFFAMHDFLSQTYAFGDWKQIPWDSMASYFGQKIMAAQADKDRNSYRIAMVEYLKCIPDGHVKITSPLDDLKERFIGGSYGLGLAELDDGSIVVAAVKPEGPAALAGICPGARIAAWNGVPIQKALVGADTRWFKNWATKDDIALERLQALTRAPIGTQAVIEFFAVTAEEQPQKEDIVVKESPKTTIATLTAYRDNFADLSLFDLAPIPTMEELRKNVEWRILEGNVGYLRIYHVIHFDNYAIYPTEVTDAVVNALDAFCAAGLNSLILDVRGNRGGSDQVAADISGHFAEEPSLFERTAWYNASSGHFDYAHSDLFAQTFELGDGPLWVEPCQPHFSGKIAVLVNPATISSGEGLAMAIGRLPKATVMGFYGTHGSFGLIPWPIAMPEDFSFEFPIGRSLDARGVIQIDSDASGKGGVQPEIRIPRTWQNIIEYALGTDVELEFARQWLLMQDSR
ncbi:MAG TPA: S41 family peptidase [Rectinema sp.]|nr:S41 family peptidase [Rectinema sp.]HQE68972.1 S41 family peptidase [Rectinema sp.]HQH95298.1 S41 family peptidase [Rectinema sp.]HRC83847.1 S41 family peptidase [Rectinema sp.]HRU03949.1 S41 family peptidase [Rectinema sp.]